MKCEEIESALIKSILDNRDSDEVKNHLAQCKSCNKFRDDIVKIFGHLNSLTVPELSEDFDRSLINEIMQTREKTKSSKIFSLTALIVILSLPFMLIINYLWYSLELSILSKFMGGNLLNFILYLTLLQLSIIFTFTYGSIPIMIYKFNKSFERMVL